MKGFYFFFFSLFGFFLMGQHQDRVDFIEAQVQIYPIPIEKRINGIVNYKFEILEDLDSVFLDAKNIDFSSIVLDNKKVKFSIDENRVSIFKKFKKGKSYSILLQYSCTPKQTVYFSGWGDAIEGNEQIWTQGQGKYTSHWLPSFDDMQEKVEFDLSLDMSKIQGLEIIANGITKEVTSNYNGGQIISFDMQKPISSYLLAFVIGDYKKQALVSKSGIPIENYYYPQDSLKVEPTYRYTREIFDFLEAEIGVPYPWQNYKQVPVHDFLYAGMENTTATIFSDGYVIDSIAFVDKNYVNVNAHELAHQWFGNLVTEKDGNHHWLHEGFATYYAYLAEKEIFGEDHFYWKLFASAKQLQEETEKGKGESLLDPKASSLTFYEKGALALFILRQQVGETPFKTGIKNYLDKYQFKNVTVTDFITEMELSSNQDLSGFKKEWLENTVLPFEMVKMTLIKHSASLKLLFEMEEEFQRIQSDDLDYDAYWDRTSSMNFKKYQIENYYRTLPETLIDKAFTSNSVQIRQALSTSLFGVSGASEPTEKLKQQFESLLDDESYVTIENALFKLWAAFPENRNDYLNKSKGVIGLPNKNVRLLWLTLAILTEKYEPTNTQDYFKELSGYTSTEYSWETRIVAFQYLRDALGFNDEALLNLMNACTHHSWQFKKFVRNLLEELLKDSDYRPRIEKLVPQLKGEELRYINTKLSK